MSRKARLLERAHQITGEELILAMVCFKRKGAALAALGGSTAGWSADTRVHRWARPVETGKRSSSGMKTQAATNLPAEIAIAVVPSEVYILGVSEGFWSRRFDELRVIARIHRERLQVEVCRHSTIQLVVLEDRDLSVTFEWEAPRADYRRAEALIDLDLLKGKEPRRSLREGGGSQIGFDRQELVLPLK